MKRCFSTLQALVAGGRPGVLVTVAHIAGSAPREPGARMLVTPTQVTGTIGGGNLEFAAMRIARSCLDDSSADVAQRFIELFPLGPMLQQCCGGAVFLHFEVVREQSDWLRAAARSEQDNAHMIMVSRTGAREPPPIPFPHQRASGEMPPVASGPEREPCQAPPREKIIFTATGVIGSLGDRRLDELAGDRAQALLAAATVPDTALLHSLVETPSALPDVSDALFFEAVSPCSFHVALFGAGHVGRALVNVLAAVPDCRITWVDSRPGQFPPALPPNVSARPTENPRAEVATLPGQAYCLIMTHDHQLDQDLCEALLRRADVAFLGLIGSAAKLRRFTQRLREAGLSAQQLQRLTCPIGIPGIAAKDPATIAIAAAAQLLEIKSAHDAD